jgi:hypothetical protein
VRRLSRYFWMRRSWATRLQVGWHYEFGKGVRRNLKKAFRWYLAAGLRETLCRQPDCS